MERRGWQSFVWRSWSEIQFVVKKTVVSDEFSLRGYNAGMDKGGT